MQSFWANLLCYSKPKKWKLVSFAQQQVTQEKAERAQDMMTVPGLCKSKARGFVSYKVKRGVQSNKTWGEPLGNLKSEIGIGKMKTNRAVFPNDLSHPVNAFLNRSAIDQHNSCNRLFRTSWSFVGRREDILSEITKFSHSFFKQALASHGESLFYRVFFKTQPAGTRS